MQIIWTIIGLIIVQYGYTQSIERQSINSAGFEFATIGEAIHITAKEGTITLTQGFQQTQQMETINNINSSFTIDYRCYPVPFSTQLTILFAQNIKSEIHFKLINSAGKEVKAQKISGQQVKIETEDLPSGNYFLQFVHQQQIIQTEKLQKL